MNKGPIGVGIIGTGFGGSVQLPGFQGIEGVRVVGLASRHREKSEEISMKHRLPKAFDSAEALIKDPDVKLVSIASPQSTHEELVTSALQAGKDILCEKPFTLNAKSSEKLLKEATRAGIVHAIDFEFRELPSWKFMKERIESGALGKVKKAELRWIVGTWADPNRQWGWQSDASVGGGVLSALGVHLLDAALWMFGDMSSLRATTGVKITERPDATGRKKQVTADDHAEIEMKRSSGIEVRIALSNVEPKGEGLSMKIECEKGTLFLESTSKQYGAGLRVREGKKVLMEPEDIPSGADARVLQFQRLAKRVIEAVRTRDTNFRPSFLDGYKSQVLLDAARKSDRSWVEISNAS